MWSWAPRTGGHVMRLILSGVFDRYPDARVILGHMGEFLPFQLSRLDSHEPVTSGHAAARALVGQGAGPRCAVVGCTLLGRGSGAAGRRLDDRRPPSAAPLQRDDRYRQRPGRPGRGQRTRRHATARQAPIPPPVRHHKPCGSRAGTGHNLTKRGCVSRLPAADSPRMVRHGRLARSDRVALPGRLDPPVPVRRGALRAGRRPGPPPASRGLGGNDAAVGDPPRPSRLAVREAGAGRRAGRLSPVARGPADRARPAVPPGVRGRLWRPGRRI